MKSTIAISALWIVLVTMAARTSAQTNTLYFMENVPSRNMLNPAFIPSQSFYLELPVISGISVLAGNNSFSLNNLLLSDNGKTITAFHPDANPDPFLNHLQSTTNVTEQNRINRFGIGIKVKKNYFTFGINGQINSNVNVPKGLLSLLLKGTPDTINTNFFDLHTLGTDESAYLETAFGYARQVSDKFSIGLKVKALFGQMHADASFNQFQLSVNRQIIQLYGSGNAHITTPFDIAQNSDGTPNFSQTDKKGWGKIVGFGMGFDMGMDYALTDQIHISGALTDIGFIHWYKSSWEAQMINTISFSGMNVTLNQSNPTFSDQLGDSVKSAFTYTKNGNGYTTALAGKFRFGVDYSVPNEKFNFGILWQNAFGGAALYNDVTVSANFRPFYCFNASLSYSLLNGNFGTIGLGLNAIAGPVNFFVLTDYLPLYFTKDGYPYKSKYVNVQLGIALTFGHKKKADIARHKQKIEEQNEENEKKEEPAVSSPPIIMN
ncbi:MAG: DUF5723 family protein [Microbacter sp.]